MAMVQYTAILKDDGSFTLPKEAQVALQLKPGDEIAVCIDSPSLLEEESLTLDKALEGLVGIVDSAPSTGGIPSRASEDETSFGEYLEWKRHAFHL